jgi:UDP-GlcNAc3NAcA epimerase
MTPIRILTVVGARPQFIKAAPVSKAIRRRGHVEFLVHTGQHYDGRMSQIFFDELEIPPPAVNLEVGSGSHARQTAQMMTGIEELLEQQPPHVVLLYGDTNSTLAGALAAVKLHIPIAHVEAGLRSFNRRMPEEHNRVLTDHCADVLLCPTPTAVGHLRNEGITRGVHLVGDVMVDALLSAAAAAATRSTVVRDLGLPERGYLLATVHRAENTDDPERLSGILRAFDAVAEPIVFPVHPRTRHALTRTGYVPPAHVRLLDPVGYLDMVMLEKSARAILTDSGGIQKEAYCLSVPCVTLRDETEWVETVSAGWNRLVGASTEKIVEAVRGLTPPADHPELFGDGRAAERCVDVLAAMFD